jgi:hypothetical protein
MEDTLQAFVTRAACFIGEQDRAFFEELDVSVALVHPTGAATAADAPFTQYAGDTVVTPPDALAR